MKVLVTGASGYVGSHVVQKLSEIGGHDVIACDILGHEGQDIPGVTYRQDDVLDRAGLLEITAGLDCIIHAAALVPLTKSGADFRRVNVDGTRNVIACCLKHDLKLVYISSSTIYGLPDDMPIKAETPYHPIEIYGRSKLDAEREVWKFMAKGGRASCIRPKTTIGGAGRLGIFHILFEWISEGKNIYIIGDGSNLFQFVHVSDLVDAIIKAAVSEKSGLYNIGTDRYGTIREDLEVLLSHAGTGSRIKSIPYSIARPLLALADIAGLSPLAPWHYRSYHKAFVFDISLAMNELGWKPNYSNQEALIESYDWYVKHKHDRTGTESSVHSRPVKQGILKLLKYFS